MHQRALIAAVPDDKWPSHVAECVRATAPGGWVELGEMNGTVHGAGPAAARMAGWSDELARVHGIKTDIADCLKDMMEQAGLVNVTAKVYQIPVGSWGGRVGEMAWTDCRSGLTAISSTLATLNEATKEEVLATIEEMGEETNRTHGYFMYNKFLGQKPE